ncbi:hypothetical protein ACU19_02270 [Actinobaculum suis]|nr:hypothetical protein ACU19_02270 [Actinobaculum suis]
MRDIRATAWAFIVRGKENDVRHILATATRFEEMKYKAQQFRTLSTPKNQKNHVNCFHPLNVRFAW